MNGEEIQNDVKRLKRKGWQSQGRIIVDEIATSNANEVNGFSEFSSGIQPGFHSNAFVDDPAALFMHPTAIVEPGVTIQTTEGPVVIGEGALIMAGSHLKGPIAIGEGAIVKMGALLYKNSTIGPHCKVGGEVSNCIFHSYSNKAHHGYAGNSIFGQWVNLGAGTTTSNLRGNYGEVRVRDWMSGEELNTGRQFLGSIMGDHIKTGINTILNTGTIVGPSSMIFGAGFAPKWIHSFSWINSDTGEIEVYDVEKSLIDMQRMMSRRDMKLSESYADMMRGISKRK
jgi:UDP-N-acetylglucosamine diphosphorylase/glucosamine-1-phosphate N-acetyltransferase